MNAAGNAILPHRMAGTAAVARQPAFSPVDEWLRRQIM